MASIFEWLERFAALRGEPAAYLVLLTAVLIVLWLDWRLCLLALAVQYFLAGLLFADMLDLRLVLVKLIVGFFVCLIVLLTALQVRYGRMPPDLTPREREQLNASVRRFSVGPLYLPLETAVRLAAALAALLLTLLLSTWLQLPGFANIPDHLHLAVIGLALLGIAGMLASRDALATGISLLTFLTGFDLYVSVLDQSANVLAGLAALNLIVALIVAYLVQTHQAGWYARLE